MRGRATEALRRRRAIARSLVCDKEVQDERPGEIRSYQHLSPRVLRPPPAPRRRLRGRRCRRHNVALRRRRGEWARVDAAKSFPPTRALPPCLTVGLDRTTASRALRERPDPGVASQECCKKSGLVSVANAQSPAQPGKHKRRSWAVLVGAGHDSGDQIFSSEPASIGRTGLRAPRAGSDGTVL